MTSPDFNVGKDYTNVGIEDWVKYFDNSAKNLRTNVDTDQFKTLVSESVKWIENNETKGEKFDRTVERTKSKIRILADTNEEYSKASKEIDNVYKKIQEPPKR